MVETVFFQWHQQTNDNSESSGSSQNFPNEIGQLNLGKCPIAKQSQQT